MIARLSRIIAHSKMFFYSHTALRLGCYALIILGLLIYWLCSAMAEVSFVYDAF